FLGIIWARAFYGSLQAYGEAERFLKQGNTIRAITYYDRSLHWYTPFNPYVQRSAERLWEIGIRAEKEGDMKLALISFQTIRGGFIASMGFYSPGKGWIERCEGKIEDIVKRAGGQGRDQGDSGRVSPGIFWSTMVEVGFLGWMGGVIGLILDGIRRKETSKPYVIPFILWIGATAGFFILWIVGMMKA
ncbi:MAG: hypothetical protein ABIG67_08270, partial [Pseudomonadota bacterium]